ncbi:MAG: hypothetical protein PGN26_16015 [Xylophilus ampelinus]
MPPSIRPIARLLACIGALCLAGCDIPGLGPDPRIAQREAEGAAIGGACRYALRGIEDCYTLNPKASKSSIFTGWRDMDQYMRENKIEGVASVLAPNKDGAAPTAGGPGNALLSDAPGTRPAGAAGKAPPARKPAPL